MVDIIKNLKKEVDDLFEDINPFMDIDKYKKANYLYRKLEHQIDFDLIKEAKIVQAYEEIKELLKKIQLKDKKEFKR